MFSRYVLCVLLAVGVTHIVGKKQYVTVKRTIPKSARAKINRPHSLQDGYDERFPKKMKLQFELDSGDVTLSLRRNSHVTSSEFQVLIGEGQEIKSWMRDDGKEMEPFAAYVDGLTNASVIATRVGKDRRMNYFRGNFQAHGGAFTIQPVKIKHGVGNGNRPPKSIGSVKGNGRPNGKPSSKGKGKGKGKGKRHKRQTYMDDYEEEEEEEDVIHEVNNVNITQENETYDYVDQPLEALHHPAAAPEHRFRRARRSLQNATDADQAAREANPGRTSYGVEQLILVDYSFFDFRFKLQDADSFRLRRDNTIEEIRFYFAIIANGVDIRYGSVREADFSIYVRPTGIFIPTTRDASPWTEENLVRAEPRNRVDSYKALDALEDWLLKRRDDLPHFDQGSLFTADYLIGSRGNRILGLAHINGVCYYWRAALNRDVGEYSLITTAAHELAHNLGALHDSDGNDCRPQDQYIMAPWTTILTNETFLNPMSFSRCSIQGFRDNFDYMNRRNENCLLNVAEGVNISISNYSSAGQRWSLDEQCQRIYGRYSYYCGSNAKDPKLCEYMSCFVQEWGYCYGNIDQRAALGTYCGNKKWCVAPGLCRYDEDAPAGPEDCFTGDFHGVLSDGRTCSQLIDQEPWWCYAKLQNDLCCDSCKQIRNRDRTDCPYGDRAAFCATSMALDCYDDTVYRDCCSTCEKIRRDWPNCEFGDRAAWCNTSELTSSGCYHNSTARVCCATCRTFRTNIIGCEYGDRASWCSGLARDSCYRENLTCCATCLNLQISSVSGCEWGDRDTYCSERNCSDPAFYKLCCLTCGGTGVTSSSTVTPQQTAVTSQVTVPTSIRPTTTPACNTGTKVADYCPTMPIANCYLGVYERTCCQRCLGARRHNDHACPYGDHYTWCVNLGLYRCREADHMVKCCDYCRAEGTTPSTTTTTTTTTASTTSTTSSTTSTTASTTSTSRSTNKPVNCTNHANWCYTLGSHHCYSEEQYCCSRCWDLYEQIPGCTYGDHMPWCATYVTSGRLCYVVDNDVDTGACCNACRPYYTGIPGCEYGDREVGCTRDKCLSQQGTEDCCLTCADLPVPPDPEGGTTITMDCTGGDEASWCETMPKSNCYVVKIRNTCCKTCRRHYTQNAGCEFGDKFTWCPNQPLDTCHRIRTDCCVRCATE